MAMIFVKTPAQFYAMRFLLGIFEAGFFPGVVLYLTYWFPADRRARINGLFMTSFAIAGVVGGPLAGFIIERDGRRGRPGQLAVAVRDRRDSVGAGRYRRADVPAREAGQRQVADQPPSRRW